MMMRRAKHTFFNGNPFFLNSHATTDMSFGISKLTRRTRTREFDRTDA